MIVTSDVNSTLLEIELYYTIRIIRYLEIELENWNRENRILRLHHTMYHEKCEGQKFATSSSQNY